MRYRKAICELVNQIKSEKTLRRIYDLVIYLWGREA